MIMNDKNKDFKKAINLIHSLKNVLKKSREDIAIIGMSCRLPGGANSLDAFWSLINSTEDAIREVPKDRFDIDQYYSPQVGEPGKIYCRHGGFLDIDVAGFDSGYFHLSPKELELMDPQHRLILELAVESLNHANVPQQAIKDSLTGIFLGISTSDYSELLMNNMPKESITGYFGTGNSASAAAGRIAHFLGAQGPTFSVDTACSSSLVALHNAVQSLRSGASDMALVGGVNMMLTPTATLNFCHARMLAEDGKCKTFDESANGYVRGEGGGFVVLKPLSRALADENDVLAVVKAAVVNQDGSSGGLTVPNGVAQEKLLRKALEESGIRPSDMDYIEAHGTGTELGDPIEVRSIGNVYGDDAKRETPLYLGSVKTHIGHLEAAAGIAGLIKCVLSLQKKHVPSHLNLQRVNPLIDLASIPAEISRRGVAIEPRQKSSGQVKMLTGVSSFGFTGTNAHVVLEEAPLVPVRELSEVQRPLHILPLSAKSDVALEAQLTQYQSYLKKPKSNKLI